MNRFRALFSFVLATLVVAAALPLRAQVGSQSSLPAAQGPQPQATITNVLDRSLKNSHFFVLGQNFAVLTQCFNADCHTATPVFSQSILCPAPAGKTCTFSVQLAAQASVTPSDLGQYRFLVDGAPPLAFQTDTAGYFNWESDNPNSGLGSWGARSYAVVAEVTNLESSQTHSVEVDIACFDGTQDGCAAAFGLGSLRVDVFRP